MLLALILILSICIKKENGLCLNRSRRRGAEIKAVKAANFCPSGI